VKSFRLPVLVVLVILSGVTGTESYGGSLDSLHIRDRDSTKIIIDTETVPAAIRSRGHQLSVLFPLGFMPREESGSAGFWQTEIRPQYANEVFVHESRMTTRLRPEIPLRYLPRHSLAGIRLFPGDSITFPLRSYYLRRRAEPMVNLVYKEGDYGLSALSIGLAANITRDTHLHLAREGTGYVGQYGIDGLETENYYLGIHHKVSEQTRFRYSTFYTKDRNNWTYATPAPGRLGSESTSWYQHFLYWNSKYGNSEWDYGLRLGSQRLWLNQSAGRQRLTELQRGAWLRYHRGFGENLAISAEYNGTEHQLEITADKIDTEMWHRIQVGINYSNDFVQIEANPQLLEINRDETASHFLGDATATVRPFPWISLNGMYKVEVFAAPYQWRKSPNRVNTQGSISRLTQFRKTLFDVRLKPTDGITFSGGATMNAYTDWHRLTYRMNAARTDSILTHEALSGEFTGLYAGFEMRAFDWLHLGTRYDVYPSVTQELPELWSRQAATGWIEVQRFFFNNNLLFHTYAEGGIILSRQPVGWHPVLQSLTLYSRFDNPSGQSFVHLGLIGDVGPFTISTSFYNLLGNNLTYAIDQRTQTQVFYLGIRWQLWN